MSVLPICMVFTTKETLLDHFDPDRQGMRVASLAPAVENRKGVHQLTATIDFKPPAVTAGARPTRVLEQASEPSSNYLFKIK